MTRNMTARAQARALGAKVYETGIPCKQGHIAPRSTATGTCTVCTQLASKAWHAANADRSAGYSAAYRERNRDEVRRKDRELKARLRVERPQHMAAIRTQAYVRQAITKNGVYRPLGRLTELELVARMETHAPRTLRYVGGYTGMLTPANFLCTVHGVAASAQPHNVLRGANPCPQCGHMASRGENEVAEYLEVFTTVLRRDRGIIGPKELDAVLPDLKLAVEYCGEFWHSGDEDSKHRHADKYKAARDAGYRLLTIYESEWRERPKAIRRLLRNAVGKSRGKLMARKCALREVPHTEAVAFYEAYHPQGGSGVGEHFGLYWRGKLVACMRFTFGANDRGSSRDPVWTLTRYATRITVAGGASRLFQAFLKIRQPSEVKSFSDNRYFDGGMYEKLGFVLEEETGPDYQVWSPKLGLRPKSHYQRKHLPKRLEEHGLTDAFTPDSDPRSEADITRLMKCRRLYDCGKKRWVWTSPQT